MPSPPHSDLKAGLAALEQKQYTQAIAYLEPVVQTNPSGSAKLRAQMGLVVAYEQTDQIEAAIAICHQLNQTSQPKVQAWATRRLQNLCPRDPTPVMETGFMPLDPIQQPAKVQPVTPPPPPKPSVVTQPKTPQKTPEKVTVSPPPKPPQNLVQPKDQPKDEPKNQPTPQPLTWQNAPRAEQWPRLKQPQFWRFRIEQVLTVMALGWFAPRLVEFLMDTANDILRELPVVRPQQWLYRDPTQWVYLTLAITFVLSPWLLDNFLKICIDLRPFPMTTLFQRSPESHRILRRYCQQRNWPVPKLRLLPITTPIVFSYGCLPRFSRIIISQGLLDQLTEDELAVILGREVAQMGQGDMFILSLVTVAMQIPYIIYWQLSHWTERLANPEALQWPQWLPKLFKSPLRFVYPVLGVITFVITPLCYGIFWLLRGVGVWLSRRRVYYSDRTAVNLTGNPNALSRALVKLAMGLAAEIQQQGQTGFFLEAFELLMPVGYHQALTFGSLAPHYPLTDLLQWDISNPYHAWLELNNSHPVMGNRLRLLTRYAQFWQLQPEFNLTDIPTTALPLDYLKLLRQGAPFFGLVAGMIIGGFIWLLGGMFALLGVWQLEWLWGDQAILTGCIPIGCGLGLFLRMNDFFPDLKPSQRLTQPNLAQLQSDPQQIPIDSIGVCLEGQLLGRSIVSNRLAQDLILSTSTGLVKLHYIPALTPLANFWPRFPHPANIVNQQVTVTGWWRRGATPWIDVEQIQTADQSLQIVGGHPIWLTLIAVILVLWGISFVSQGGF